MTNKHVEVLHMVRKDIEEGHSTFICSALGDVIWDHADVASASLADAAQDLQLYVQASLRMHSDSNPPLENWLSQQLQLGPADPLYDWIYDNGATLRLAWLDRMIEIYSVKT
jgi:hypothetical protein